MTNASLVVQEYQQALQWQSKGIKLVFFFISIPLVQIIPVHKPENIPEGGWKKTMLVPFISSMEGHIIFGNEPIRTTVIERNAMVKSQVCPLSSLGTLSTVD